MSWKTLITARTFDRVGEPAREVLEGHGGRLVIPPRFGPLPEEELASVLEGADAVLCSPDAYTARLLARPVASRLKILSRWGVGYDSIDLRAATEAGIVVAYTPGLLDEAVADYAMALLFTLARRTAVVDSVMKQGGWEVAWGCDIAGKTLGIIGCGRIGRAVARRAAGFGMRLLGSDVQGSPELASLGVELVPLDTLLEASDFVTLHAALTPESRGMMGAAQFRRMKPDALFVNTARGAHVDTAALVRALEEGRIGGAAVDVHPEEPLPSDHPLRRAPNVVLSPHQSSCTLETGRRISEVSARAIVDLQEGRRPLHVVNPEVFESGTLRARLGS